MHVQPVFCLQTWTCKSDQYFLYRLKRAVPANIMFFANNLEMYENAEIYL